MESSLYIVHGYMAFDFFLEKDTFEVLLFFGKKIFVWFLIFLETDICEVVDFFGKIYL